MGFNFAGNFLNTKSLPAGISRRLNRREQPLHVSFSIFLQKINIFTIFRLSYATPWVRRRRAEYLEPEIVYRSSPEQKFPVLLQEDRDAPKRYTPSSCYLSVIIPAMNEVVSSAKRALK